MSEFTKLAALLEHVHTSATALRERYMAEDAPTVADTVVADHHAAQALHDELTITLLPGVAKFHTKIHATDPVTGIERFGPQMKAKIVALAEQMEAVVTVCAATLETIEPLARRAREMQMAKEQLAAAAAAAEAHAEQAAAATAVAAADAAAAAAASAGAAAAAEQREQRRLAEETRCRRKHLSSVLQRLLTLLNERPRGAAATASALTRLQASCLDAPTLTAALRTATTILEGISARPDNALLRRLRLFHPDLHGRLLRHDGGVALLLAVGFHIKCVPAISSSPWPLPHTASPTTAAPPCSSPWACTSSACLLFIPRCALLAAISCRCVLPAAIYISMCPPRCYISMRLPRCYIFLAAIYSSLLYLVGVYSPLTVQALVMAGLWTPRPLRRSRSGWCRCTLCSPYLVRILWSSWCCSAPAPYLTPI